MNRKPNWPMALILTALAAAAAAPTVQAGGSCNNYGIQVNTSIFSEQDCSSHEYVQHCDQGTGAGAGAGAGAGQGSGEAGASASAGTNCTQNGEGNSTADNGWGGPVLGQFGWNQPLPDSSDLDQHGLQVDPLRDHEVHGDPMPEASAPDVAPTADVEDFASDPGAAGSA